MRQCGRGGRAKATRAIPKERRTTRLERRLSGNGWKIAGPDCAVGRVGWAERERESERKRTNEKHVGHLYLWPSLASENLTSRQERFFPFSTCCFLSFLSFLLGRCYLELSSFPRNTILVYTHAQYTGSWKLFIIKLWNAAALIDIKFTMFRNAL
jgi:hypothetical protein